MRYYLNINDGFTKRIGASTRSALIYATAEYHGLAEDEVAVRETDDGDMVHFLQGPDIGLIEKVTT